jgi:hypothetical protein
MSQEKRTPLEIEEDKLLEEEGFEEVPPSEIVTFNELRSCADLVRMVKLNQLRIELDFQRDLVWSQAAQTRFIDSLLKQLPIPSMCLSLDYKSQERLMIDGLQRISSVVKFLTDDDWKLSKLDDIDNRISGQTTGYLRKKHPEIYDQIENVSIPITIVRCDYSKKSHLNYLFKIFHRLNTGGTKLNNQEIRNCIFHGRFNDVLKGLVQYPKTRALFSLKKGETYRFSYEEFILRVLAFSETYEKYNGKLGKFLNDYMEDNKKISDKEIEKKASLIERAVELLHVKILDGQALDKISRTTTEAIFIGIIRNIEHLETEPRKKLFKRMQSLIEDELFSTDSLKEGLAAKEKVQVRLKKAIEIFS